MRPTPPFSLLTFPCNAAEINSNFSSENAAMVLKSLKRVKEMFCRFFIAVRNMKTVRFQMVVSLLNVLDNRASGFRRSDPPRRQLTGE